jgi:signal transduction histidine kinase
VCLRRPDGRLLGPPVTCGCARIERDLHDGTQAQLVALAMRLGMAKEKLAAGDETSISTRYANWWTTPTGAPRRPSSNCAIWPAGIHPPALDVGLEGALATLAARSTVPTELTVTLHDRPTPAIEAIAYFCVAELLANVAQHAQASRAEHHVHGTATGCGWSCATTARAGPSSPRLGSSSSGLVGLTDRVHAVDGRLDIASPPRGPTVVTVDLPLHA